MAFHYRASAPAQHLVTGLVLLVVVGVIQVDATADAWRTLVTGTPAWALLVIGTFVLHKAVFWPLALLFHHADTHDRPRWIARHRIQGGPPRRPELSRTLAVLARNQLLFTPPLLVGLWWLLDARGWRPSPELPSLGSLAVDMVLLILSGEVIFYLGHRLLHRPWWMKRVHRVHHEFRTSSALASEYAHPVEFVLGNFAALAGGVAIFGPSLPAIYLFTAVSVFTIVVHHSGYAVPWLPWSVAHDWHHYRYTDWFGNLGLMDRIFGTEGAIAELEDGEVR